jgi:hypothetical protein
MNHPATGQPRKRKPLLIIMLVIVTIGGVAATLVNLDAWSSMLRHNQSTYLWVAVSGTLIGLGSLVGIVGAWMWQRWAVFLLVVLLVIGLVLDSSVMASGMVPYLIIRIGVFALLATAIWRQWDSFA